MARLKQYMLETKNNPSTDEADNELELIEVIFWQAYLDVVAPSSADDDIDVCFYIQVETVGEAPRDTAPRDTAAESALISWQVIISETPGDQICYWPPLDGPAQPSSLDDEEVERVFCQAAIESGLSRLCRDRNTEIAVVAHCDHVEIFFGDVARRVVENLS